MPESCRSWGPVTSLVSKKTLGQTSAKQIQDSKTIHMLLARWYKCKTYEYNLLNSYSEHIALLIEQSDNKFTITMFYIVITLFYKF